MKIQVANNLNPKEVIRRAGYGQVNDHFATEESWSRRLGSAIYPRFHAYVNGQEINLHLDQKQVSYKGYSAHSGEYDSEVVSSEAGRIIGMMQSLIGEQTGTVSQGLETKKGGLFGRIFGV